MILRGRVGVCRFSPRGPRFETAAGPGSRTVSEGRRPFDKLPPLRRNKPLGAPSHLALLVLAPIDPQRGYLIKRRQNDLWMVAFSAEF
jgi:hypothetical protein